MKVAEKLDVLATIVVCVVAVGALVRGADRGESRAGGLGPPQTLEHWREVSEAGLWLGPRDAPVVITEFVDFQCPFCAQLGPTLDSLLDEQMPLLAVSLQHFPLTIHPNAEAAAIAVECADRQGATRPYIMALYQRQSDFAHEPWLEVARAAGVPDESAFEECVGLPADAFPRITSGQDLALARGVNSTPSVWINGNLTSRASIRRNVLDALGGRN